MDIDKGSYLNEHIPPFKNLKSVLGYITRVQKQNPLKRSRGSIFKPRLNYINDRLSAPFVCSSIAGWIALANIMLSSFLKS